LVIFINMALTKTDTEKIERIVRREIKDFMETPKAKNIVVKTVEEELFKNGIVDRKAVVDITTKSIVELFRQLWMRRNFWEQPLKNMK